jgi:hypothetical protein
VIAADYRAVRLTRGLFQSVGASCSLLAAVAFALFAVSAIVGFRGWPGLGADAAGPRALALASPRQPRSRPRVQRAGRPSGAFAAPRRLLAAAEPRPVAPRRVAAAPAPAARIPAPAPPAPNLAAVSGPVAAPKRPVTHQVAQTVRDTGTTAAATVAPVSPEVAQTVTGTAGTVADALEKTGDVLAP